MDGNRAHFSEEQADQGTETDRLPRETVAGSVATVTPMSATNEAGSIPEMIAVRYTEM